MNPVKLRRIAIASAVLAILVGIDGFYMVFSNYQPDDTSNNGFGSFHPSDGQTVLIAAAILLIVAIIAFVLSIRSQPKLNKQAPEAEAQA
jgi:Na+(H+)/acetate symporter ActP